MKELSFLFAVIICVVFLSWSSESRAIGDTEQGILWGVLGTVTLSKIFEQDDQDQYYPANPNGEFPPFRCSGDSVQCAYERGRWEREREEWLKEKDRAYQCGRFGKCE